MKTRNAFTLVELLVVVAIIALLLAILLPALNKAKEVTVNTVCLSNQRQMGVVMHTYASGDRDFPVYTYIDQPSLVGNPRRSMYNGTMMWSYMLPWLKDEGYMGDVEVGYCPKAGSVDETGRTSIDFWPGGGNFRMDHDSAIYPTNVRTGNIYTTHAKGGVNMGDYFYRGPGTNNYDLEHMGWGLAYFDQLNRDMAAGYGTGKNHHIAHWGGVHIDKAIRYAYSNKQRNEIGEVPGESAPLNLNARVPLLNDSFLKTDRVNQWWAGITYGPHFSDDIFNSKINTVFFDGSAETRAVW